MPCPFPVHSGSAFDDQTLRRVNTARIRRASQSVGVEGDSPNFGGDEVVTVNVLCLGGQGKVSNRFPCFKFGQSRRSEIAQRNGEMGEEGGKASCLGIEERRDTRDRRGKKGENSGGMDARLSVCVCTCVRAPKKTLDSFAWARERKLHLHREEGKGVIKAGRWPAEESFFMPRFCVFARLLSYFPVFFCRLTQGKFS